MTWMQPRPHQRVGRHGLHLLALEDDRALRHLAALGAEQVGDRLERRSSCRPRWRPESRPRRRAGTDSETPFQHENDVIRRFTSMLIDRQDGFGGIGGRHLGLVWSSSVSCSLPRDARPIASARSSNSCAASGSRSRPSPDCRRAAFRPILSIRHRGGTKKTSGVRLRQHKLTAFRCLEPDRDPAIAELGHGEYLVCHAECGDRPRPPSRRPRAGAGRCPAILSTGSSLIRPSCRQSANRGCGPPMG